MAKIEAFPGDTRHPDQEKEKSQEAAADITARRTAHEIFTNVEKGAHDELRRTTRALAFSGLAGGFGMGLTGLGVASVQAVLGEGKWQEYIALLFYPLGFISVIIGRA